MGLKEFKKPGDVVIIHFLFAVFELIAVIWAFEPKFVIVFGLCFISFAAAYFILKNKVSSDILCANILKGVSGIIHAVTSSALFCLIVCSSIYKAFILWAASLVLTAILSVIANKNYHRIKVWAQSEKKKKIELCLCVIIVCIAFVYIKLVPYNPNNYGKEIMLAVVYIASCNYTLGFSRARELSFSENN